MDEFEKELSENTAIVSVMLANNEGFLFNFFFFFFFTFFLKKKKKWGQYKTFKKYRHSPKNMVHFSTLTRAKFFFFFFFLISIKLKLKNKIKIGDRKNGDRYEE